MLLTAGLANAQAPEESSPRTYGDKGRSIELNKRLPAWVTTQIAGPRLDTKPKRLHAPDRPVVVVVCKELAPESETFFRSLDSCAIFGDFSIYVIVVDSRGIAGDESLATFPASQYHSMQSFEKLSEDLVGVFDQFQLSKTTLSVARNRHLRGMHKDKMTVAFIRGHVQCVDGFESYEPSRRQILKLLKKLGQLYRSSSQAD